MQDFLMNILLSGVGASLVLLIITRLIPNESLYNIIFSFCKKITDKGRSKLGVAFWKPIRGFIQNSMGIIFEAANEGLGFYDRYTNETMDGNTGKPMLENPYVFFERQKKKRNNTNEVIQ